MSKGCSNAPLCTGDASAARRGAPVNASTANVDTAIDKSIDSGHLIRRPIRIAGIAPSEIPQRVERQPERAPRERDRHRPRTPVRPPRRACLHQQRDTVSRDGQDRRRHDRARGRDQWSTRRCVQHCMRDVSRNRRLVAANSVPQKNLTARWCAPAMISGSPSSVRSTDPVPQNRAVSRRRGICMPEPHRDCDERRAASAKTRAVRTRSRTYLAVVGAAVLGLDGVATLASPGAFSAARPF